MAGAPERPGDLDPLVPFPPMEAELVRELPLGEGWTYEPKWDGFRGVLENAGGELRLWSRNGRPLLRYFPELRPLGELLPPRSALDGEIVIDTRRRDRLRRDADAPASRGEPDPEALGRDPGTIRRLRLARLGRVAGMGAAIRGASNGAGARCRRVLALPLGFRPGRGAVLAPRARGARPRRGRREAAR